MELRNLGRSGLRVSVVGLGCNNFGRQCDLESTRRIVDSAIDAGVTLFDTADVYGLGLSEEYLGRCLRRKRHDVVIATKFGVHAPEGGTNLYIGASRKEIVQAVEASLRRLNTEYIDLLQLHWSDPSTPITEILSTLDTIVREGKARYIGHSNFAGWQAVEAHFVAQANHLIPFVSAQNQYSLLHRQIDRELVPACVAYGISILPYWPLASGFLTGKYRRGEEGPAGARLSTAGNVASRIMSERNWVILEKLERFAQARDHSLVDLALGWLASQPHVASVIAGATRPEQIDQNVAGCVWRLSSEDLEEIDRITI